MKENTMFQRFFTRLILGLFLFTGCGARFLCAEPSTNAVFGASVAKTGPTLRLEYGEGQSNGNPVIEFMYFVPLISPEPVTVSQSEGNTQRARVISATSRATATTFSTVCEFEFTGAGVQQNVLDHAENIRRNDQYLKKGGCLERQLSSINVEGAGSGCIEIEGTLTNQVRIVNEVRLRFNRHGHASPVSITLQDLRMREGQIESSNELVARVNSLTFRRDPGSAKMDVSVASVKPKAAGHNLWQSMMGGVRGAAANMLLKPITVEPAGHQAMLEFGQALAAKAPNFTFPVAAHLK